MAALATAALRGRTLGVAAEHELLAEVTGKLYDLDCVLGLAGWDDEQEDWSSTPSPASSGSGSQVVTNSVHDLPSAPTHTLAAAGRVPVSAASTPAGSLGPTPQHSPEAEPHQQQAQPEGVGLGIEVDPAGLQPAEGETLALYTQEATQLQEATHAAEGAGTAVAPQAQAQPPPVSAPAQDDDDDDDLPSLPSAAVPPPPPAKPALPTMLYIPPPPHCGHSQLDGRAHSVFGPYARALAAGPQQASPWPFPPELSLLAQHALPGDATETDESSRPTTPTTPTTPGTSGGEEGGVRRKKKRELATYLRDRGMGSRPGTPTGRQHMAAVSATVSNVCPEDSPWMDFRLVFDPILSGMVGPNGLPTRPPIYHAIHCRHTENVCTKKDPRGTAPPPRRLFLAEVPAFARPNLMAGLVAGPAAPLARAPTPTSAPQSRASSPATVMTAGTRSSSQSPLAPTVETAALAPDQWPQQQFEPLAQQVQQLAPQVAQATPPRAVQAMAQTPPPAAHPPPHTPQPVPQASPQRRTGPAGREAQVQGAVGGHKRTHADTDRQQAEHVQAPPAKAARWEYEEETCLEEGHWDPAQHAGQQQWCVQEQPAGQATTTSSQIQQQWCVQEQPAGQATSTSSQIHREWFEAVAMDTQRRGGRGVGRSGHGSSGEEKDEARLKTVFVGDLPPSTGKDELGQLFEPHGVVEELRTFPGKNYAFVVYTCFEHAERAIAAMDGHWHRGSQLRVARGGRRGFCKREWTDTDTNSTKRAGGEGGGGGSFDDELRALLKKRR